MPDVARPYIQPWLRKRGEIPAKVEEALRARPGATAQELADYAGVTTPSMVRSLYSMRGLGLARFEVDDDGWRKTKRWFAQEEDDETSTSE